MSVKTQVIMDLECYTNYFLISLLRPSDDKIVSFDFSGENTLDVDRIESILANHEIITFNGNGYDIPMLGLALKGANTYKLKTASDELIVGGLKPYQFNNKYEIPELEINHIDLIEVAPSKTGLKIYGGRLHCEKMQDLPYEPDKILTNEEMLLVKTYCGNDLIITKLLLADLTPQIDLRRNMSNQYKIDLRSKSDAQIAEEVIKAEIKRKTKCNLSKPKPPETFIYQAPEFIKFKSTRLNEVLKIFTTRPFVVNNKNGKIEMPKEVLTLKVGLGESTYQLGMGGLHSTESCVNHIADKNTILCDVDVTSYYPSIILNCGLYPKQLGEKFLDVYKELVDARIAGKREKNMVIADSLRIVINGSFGKLGSRYSALYSPELMIQVTVTGQLSLLMLVEALENNGVPVVSGNTDGIVVKCSRAKESVFKATVLQWETDTGFNMERTDYSGIYSRDVNNYIAVKSDGKVKSKGCFKLGGLQKNPQNEICIIAVIKYITEGASLEDTIAACKDITKFVTVRKVEGGAVKGNRLLGKAIRWYYAKNERGTINYKTNNNTVPRTIGAKPIMDLPSIFPTDVDYHWYIEEARDLLSDINLEKKGQLSLF